MGSELVNFFPAFKRNSLFGELKLQSCEEANIFYALHVQTDENLGQGDFSQFAAWQEKIFTHQNKQEEDVVIVDGDTTILDGIFTDRIGDMNQADYEYVVSVYVWVEIDEPNQKKGDKK